MPTYRYPIQGTVRDGLGNAISGATVTAYESGTSTAATCYEGYDSTTYPTALTGGSTTSDSNGKWAIYFDDGVYPLLTHFDIEVSKTGYGTKKYLMVR